MDVKLLKIEEDNETDRQLFACSRADRTLERVG
jgi:hypothetical protein